MIRQAINLTENDRQALAILMISAELEEISVYHLQDALFVSRGTILADIKKYRNMPKKMMLSLSIVDNLVIVSMVMKD